MLMMFLRNLFTRTKTVDSIIADVEKKVNDLLIVAARKREERIAAQDKADEYIRQAAAADNEAYRAEQIAAKFANLIG